MDDLVKKLLNFFKAPQKKSPSDQGAPTSSDKTAEIKVEKEEKQGLIQNIQGQFQSLFKKKSQDGDKKKNPPNKISPVGILVLLGAAFIVYDEIQNGEQDKQSLVVEKEQNEKKLDQKISENNENLEKKQEAPEEVKEEIKQDVKENISESSSESEVIISQEKVSEVEKAPEEVKVVEEVPEDVKVVEKVREEENIIEEKDVNEVSQKSESYSEDQDKNKDKDKEMSSTPKIDEVVETPNIDQANTSEVSSMSEDNTSFEGPSTGLQAEQQSGLENENTPGKTIVSGQLLTQIRSIAQSQSQNIQYIKMNSEMYEERGQGLVYDCVKGRWACVNERVYSICENNLAYYEKNKSSELLLECMPKDVYMDLGSCRAWQREMIVAASVPEQCEGK